MITDLQLPLTGVPGFGGVRSSGRCQASSRRANFHHQDPSRPAPASRHPSSRLVQMLGRDFITTLHPLHLGRYICVTSTSFAPLATTSSLQFHPLRFGDYICVAASSSAPGPLQWRASTLLLRYQLILCTMAVVGLRPLASRVRRLVLEFFPSQAIWSGICWLSTHSCWATT